MAKPRIFISSTYYDLKYVRSDLERFIKDQGYEPVLNEYGHIPYGSKEKLEQYCYKEIENCDILVAVIGGRYGSESQEGKGSVSNMELKTAIEQGKQAYVFIDKSVNAEYQTYLCNKDSKGIKFASVDNVKIFEFIEEIHALKVNNQIQSFDSVLDITKYLREQWAGLFQRLLSESARQKEVKIIEDLKHTSSTLNQLVDYLIAEKSKGDSAINDILFSNHPAFDEVRKKGDLPIRIIFSTKDELFSLFKSYNFIEDDDAWRSQEGYTVWKIPRKGQYIKVADSIFDENGKLKSMTPSDWKDEFILIEDDIPF